MVPTVWCFRSLTSCQEQRNTALHSVQGSLNWLVLVSSLFLGNSGPWFGEKALVGGNCICADPVHVLLMVSWCRNFKCRSGFSSMGLWVFTNRFQQARNSIFFPFIPLDQHVKVFHYTCYKVCFIFRPSTELFNGVPGQNSLLPSVHAPAVSAQLSSVLLRFLLYYLFLSYYLAAGKERSRHFTTTRLV